LVPSVVTWARGPLAHLSGVHLADPRVSLKLIDVHDEISAARNRYDAILLDVDNGPEGFIKLENDRLYCNWGLREAHAALRPGGVLAIWSAFPDPDFVERLERAGFEVDETLVPAFADAVDDWHRLLFAAKPN
ncbi:MAG TPA: spermidine synthase, partial [Sphingobium sp.]|nr:spermidine synthase [Sphingobium sp.]